MVAKGTQKSPIEPRMEAIWGDFAVY